MFYPSFPTSPSVEWYQKRKSHFLVHVRYQVAATEKDGIEPRDHPFAPILPKKGKRSKCFLST